MMNIPYKHTNIPMHCPRDRKNLSEIYSKQLHLCVSVRLTRRALRELTLHYVHCPDCEGKDIIFHGHDKKGTQRFKCKLCEYQFVSQYDAIFPRSQRWSIFGEEFQSNIKPTGFDKIGSGKKLYWDGARLETLQTIESQTIKVRANRMIKDHPVACERDYRVMLEFLLNEAYVFAIA